MVVQRCLVIFYRQQVVYLIVSSLLLTFVTTLIVYSIKRIENVSCSIACKKEQIEFLEYPLLITKIH